MRLTQTELEEVKARNPRMPVRATGATEITKPDLMKEQYFQSAHTTPAGSVADDKSVQAKHETVVVEEMAREPALANPAELTRKLNKVKKTKKRRAAPKRAEIVEEHEGHGEIQGSRKSSQPQNVGVRSSKQSSTRKGKSMKRYTPKHHEEYDGPTAEAFYHPKGEEQEEDEATEHEVKFMDENQEEDNEEGEYEEGRDEEEERSKIPVDPNQMTLVQYLQR